MDERDQPPVPTSWGPSPAVILTAGVLGLVMVLAASASGTDRPGRVLAGVAGAGLLLYAVLTWRARPKLAITGDGLVMRGWFGARQLSRADVQKVRITEFRRLARKVRLLEIDTNDDRLLVFTRTDLGTDPIHVLDALTEAGYA